MYEAHSIEPAREHAEAERALADRRRYDQWSDALKAEHARKTGERTIQVMRFQVYLGSLVAAITLLWDFLVMPDQFGVALVWRLLTIAPLNVAALVLLSRGRLQAAKVAAGGSIIALGMIAMHLASFGGEALMTRYCMATAFLLGIASLALPFTPAEIRKFALAFVVLTGLAAMWPNPLDPVIVGTHIALTLLIGGTSVAVAKNYWESDARGFLKDLREEATREALEQSNRLLRQLAERDPLTGCLNRRGFDRLVEKLLVDVSHAEADPEGRQPIGRATAIMIDLDHFKRFNDTHGHQAGDTCLSMVASTLEGIFGEAGGIVARFGGEEFVAGFRERREGEAVAVAERVRLAIADLLVPVGDGVGEREDEDRGGDSDNESLVTASIGIGLSEDITRPIAPEASAALREQLIEMADAALYSAKRAGRNRVEVTRAGDTEPVVGKSSKAA